MKLAGKGWGRQNSISQGSPETLHALDQGAASTDEQLYFITVIITTKVVMINNMLTTVYSLEFISTSICM